MEFWRHGWSTVDWFNFPYILTNLKNFGFIDAKTNEEIDDTSKGSHIFPNTNSSSTAIKWRYDLQANWSDLRSIFGIHWGDYSPYNWGAISDSITGIDVFFTNNYRLNLNARHEAGATMSLSPSTNNFQTFFIPLKNNGFFMNLRTYGTDSLNWNIDPDHSSMPQLWTSGKAFEQNWEDVNNREIILGTISPSWTCTNIIGIPVGQNLSNVSFLYILLSNYKYFTGRNIAKITDGLLMHDFLFHETIPDFKAYQSVQTVYPGTKEEQGIQDSFYQSHIDMTRNVCTLIKYPYESVLLDNLYIMTTAPTTFTDEVGFFTINNRNFMKVFENIVVELPIN